MRDAVISPCGTYRYTLGRHIPGDSLIHKPCLFVMLNPSKADATKDDPTIRRCIGFAKREGCTQLTVVNLFAYPATDPVDLDMAYMLETDVYGPENNHHIDRELRRHNAGRGHLIIAAWGGHPMAMRARATRAKLRDAGAMCLGMTRGGEPRHPVRLWYDTPLVPWVVTAAPSSAPSRASR
jgi:hypothetical protein